jgi:4-amino-4-deoxychorismate lyase
MIAVLINGRRPNAPDSAIDVSDRGLHYGDGLFETMLLREGRVRWLDEHWQRLQAGCRRLSIPCPALDLVRHEIRELGAPGDGVIKLIVTRGLGGRGYAPPAALAATRILALYSLPQASSFEVSARWCTVRLGRNTQLAGIKHLNRLEQVLAQREVAAAGLDEGLMLDDAGELISAVASNVFLVQAGVLLTPGLRYCGVKGVMRAQVQRIAEELGIPVRETALQPHDVSTAEEVFLTNAVRGLRPLVALEAQRWPVGPITLQLHTTLMQQSDGAIRTI